MDDGVSTYRHVVVPIVTLAGGAAYYCTERERIRLPLLLLLPEVPSTTRLFYRREGKTGRFVVIFPLEEIKVFPLRIVVVDTPCCDTWPTMLPEDYFCPGGLS